MGVQKWFTDEYTAVLQKLVKEIVNDPKTYKGSQLLPSVAVPSNKIRVEVIEASGGLTNEHKPGVSPTYIRSFGTRAQEFTPPKYKEAIHYDEEKLLYLRELGNNDTSLRGVRKYIDQDIDRLNRRIEARVEKLRWDSIFSGGYSWMGNSISFGIPSSNRVVPVGALWSTDGINANDSANPIKDIRYWLMGGTSNFRKYQFKRMWMNGNTARWVLDNANTRAFLTSYGANPAMTEYDINKAMSFLIPGVCPVEVYNGWYQTESIDGNGKLVVSDPIFFIPDGLIFFEVELPGQDKIGEFVQSVHLAGGTIDQPESGKFLVIDDNTAVGTKGGPANPYIDLVGGVYGGAKLDRPFDLLTAKVIA